MKCPRVRGVDKMTSSGGIVECAGSRGFEERGRKGLGSRVSGLGIRGFEERGRKA